MGYLEEFQQRIVRDDYPGFLHLWEEYAGGDEIDGRELVAILEALRHSRFAHRFGEYVETALPLLEYVDDAETRFSTLRLILDLETSENPELAELAYRALEEAYGDEPDFQEKIRLVGLRNRDSFQGAIRNMELLRHLRKGAFVFHTGGWGTGEVLDLSLIREEIILEFEGVAGKKSLSFENAFSSLTPLDEEHFLAERFGDPDALEEKARKNPVGVIRHLLRDLGPKTAAEIKEELCDLVIPAEDWTRWWQSARSRVKKDTQIETPTSVKLPFKLRKEALTHAERARRQLEKAKDPDDVILTTYNFLRDFPEVLSNNETKSIIRDRLMALTQEEGLALPQKIQALALLEEFFDEKLETNVASLVTQNQEILPIVHRVQIGALKKRLLQAIRRERSDWLDLFLETLFSLEQGNMREYLVKEVVEGGGAAALTERLEKLLELPVSHPQLFVWYFQKIALAGERSFPLAEEEDLFRWFENCLILLHQLEHLPEYRELVKKIMQMLIAKRYLFVREMLKESTREFAQEFLLLISKCHSFTSHDQKIMRSLVEVAHPDLVKEEEREAKASIASDQVIWTTQQGYQKIHNRIEEIGTVETVDNAREIERAREHGDLRENAEYKAALERRARLQGELKMLSDQIHKARILTAADITVEEVGVGTIITLVDEKDKKVVYTLLGPWDANPEEHILSYQSKLAQAMLGKKVGDRFTHQDRTFHVEQIESYFDSEHSTVAMGNS